MTSFEQKIWFVYRGSESLGPFSASELRAALRVGELDPFEKVGRASSSVRQNLIDIDEIFNTESLEMDQLQGLPEIQQVQSAQVQSIQPQQSTGTDGRRNHSIQVSSTSAHGSSFSDGYFGGAAVNRDTPSSRPPEDFRQNLKPFYVTHKGKFWGPFHAPEIVAEYRRGNIPKRSYVLRNGYKAKLHIQKFVSQYNQRLVARGPQRSLIHPMASEKKIFVLKSPDPSQWLAIAFVALCILIMSFLAYDYLVKTRTPDRGLETKQTTEIENVPPIRSIEQPSFQSTIRPPAVAPRKAPVQIRQPLVYQPAATIRNPIKNTQVQSFKPKPARKPAVKKAVKNRRVVKKTKPVARKPKTSSLGSVAGLKGKIGSQVSLGPLSYSTSAVKNCKGKCSIRFRGRNGSVTGIFFKSVYGGSLLKQKGKARIKGRVMVGGKSLLIQAIN